MSYLETYIDDLEMIAFYTDTFVQDDLKNCLLYYRHIGIPADDLTEILLDFQEFLYYWNMWQDKFDF